MAKSKKTGTKTPKKAAPAKKKTVVSPEELIVGACESALSVLAELNLDFQLQSEINWCLGSYRNDYNPEGLYQMAERSLTVLREEQGRKNKAVTTKLISGIEKAISARR